MILVGGAQLEEVSIFPMSEVPGLTIKPPAKEELDGWANNGLKQSSLTMQAHGSIEL
jgi:hypothetical protein